jgi:hypothetical protein
MMDIDTYELLVRRSLEAGVPPGVVAGIFELTTDVAKELQRQVRVERYGTADMAEYLDSIQFQTLERAQQLLEEGSPEQAARIVNSVFGRQLANAGKRPSSALEEQRAELMAAMKGVREGTASGSGPGRFVVGRTDVERRAHRVEDDEDD